MSSTKKYQIDKINSNVFLKIFKKERPKLSLPTSDEDCEQLALKLIRSIKTALEPSAPKSVRSNGPFERSSIAYRIPRNLQDLFNISRTLYNENRRNDHQMNSSFYSNNRSNYSKHDFFEKQLSFYVGDQCSNRLAYRELDWTKVFKQGKLIIFRKQNRTGYHPSNYRFITIQTAICKIYERLIIDKLQDSQLTNYLNQITNQHGFTKNKSRYTALNTVIDEMSIVKESNQYGILIQVDISRAFDLISWDHILEIVKNNLNDEKFIIITQLLKDRTIEFNDLKRKLHRGLPQGSASSHLLWLIGTSDLMLELQSLQNLRSVGFVDDLAFICKGKTVKEVINKVNQIKMVLERWLKSAALTLNEDKCVYMQFSGKTKIDLSNMEINQVKLRRVNKTKYLGVHLDRNIVSLNHQIREINSKMKEVNKAIRTMFALSPIKNFTSKDLMQIYNRIIKHILLSGWFVWGKSVIGIKRLTDQLRNTQKKALVALFRDSEYNSNMSLCKRHRILPIDLELEVNICEQFARENNNQRRLTIKERKTLEQRVMQKNNFHWDS